VLIVENTPSHQWSGSATPSPVPETTEAMATRGDAEAQFSLGLKFATSTGSSQDYAQAEHWYLKAASQNHALSHFNLGMMHANGQGVPCDPAKSLEWLQKAADLGDAGAQFTLGTTFYREVIRKRSEDVSQTRIDAYKWFWLAADQGYRGAQVACDRVNLDMSREDVVEGARRIAEFQAGK
jgi:uncharacterized protein